jgi:dolichol kinase
LGALSKRAYDMNTIDLEDAASPSEPARSARPENVTRSLFHIGSAVVALLMLRLLPGRPWLIGASGALALGAWTCEISRRISPRVNVQMMRLFSRVAHPGEREKVNSSTWYLTALVGLAIFAPLRSAELGVVVLGLADPAAGFIGRRIGRTKILANRSLEGTLGFFAVGTLAALGLLAIFYGLPLPMMLLVAAVSGATGAIAELVSARFDDNFTIPVTVAIAATVTSMFFGAGA